MLSTKLMYFMKKKRICAGFCLLVLVMLFIVLGQTKDLGTTERFLGNMEALASGEGTGDVSCNAAGGYCAMGGTISRGVHVGALNRL